MGNEIEVTPEDREAASDLMVVLFTGVSGLESDLGWAAPVRRGEDDSYPIVQAFARHRIESARNARMEALDERGWLVEENFGDAIHWIAVADGEWPLVRIKSFHRDYGVGIDREEYLTPVRRVKAANEALRFARKEDAEAFIRLFGRFLLQPLATEHAWPPPSRPKVNPMKAEEIAAGMTERDGEMLDDLVYACAKDLEWHSKGYRTGRTPGYSRPLDCGGSNSSDHSYRLSKLVKMGLAESKQRWGVSSSGRRGSKVYRPTPLGLAVREALMKEKGL